MAVPIRRYCSASHFINQLAFPPHIPTTVKHKGVNCALCSWCAVHIFFFSPTQQSLRLPSVNDQGRIGHQCKLTSINTSTCGNYTLQMPISEIRAGEESASLTIGSILTWFQTNEDILAITSLISF